MTFRRAFFIVLVAALAVSTMTSAAPMAMEKRTSKLEDSANRSPGLVSGDAVDIPINIPINLCGDSIDIIGLINPVSGNICEQKEGHDKSATFKEDESVDVNVRQGEENDRRHRHHHGLEDLF
ncbi:hypothetical protein EDD11_006925 [Mortierella claussenii]|nr:hypothetical protein EDD11_006925 [Mortierella claussenii]